ncbi:DsbA family oxidoreductase [Metabacillus bambusae]|uniref:DsbA family oxidoreductase n=1 Tax=Metabacillus bambusae TaxID=2795218 RepID=A0ABS3N1E4_9BACI|nr:DsbA family oxidoreductase [Metabacillus bambusae]MBO1512067.1 DsbA family oxidoreductase [Metabacillus bambusae]
MLIEIWSDIVCPYCYIGKRRLEEALAKFQHKEEVKIEYRSFELNPDAKVHYDEDNVELLSKKYGTSKEQIKAMNLQLTEQAKEIGLTYHLDKIKATNTLNAHRLIQLAKQYGKENEMVERLFKAYFTEVRHVGETKTLIELASEIGLDQEKVQSMLNSNEYEVDVRVQEQEAQQIGVTGVPFYVINRKYAISGAQPSDVFLEVMEKVRVEELEK